MAPPFVGEKLINGKFYIINSNFDTKGQIINLNPPTDVSAFQVMFVESGIQN